MNHQDYLALNRRMGRKGIDARHHPLFRYQQYTMASRQVYRAYDEGDARHWYVGSGEPYIPFIEDRDSGELDGVAVNGRFITETWGGET